MTGTPVFDELPPPPQGQRRKRRRDLIRQFVAQYAVRSQGELVALLAQEGVEATQATVSRDLEELGIAKLRGADGRVTYALPEPYGLNLILRQFALTIEASGNLAVITTPPGTAGAVAAAIDGADVPDVLATVQGDDTVLVVAREPADGRAVADRLAALANPPPPLENRNAE